MIETHTIPRRHRTRSVLHVAVLGVLVVGLAGCFSVFRVKGSGTPETTTFDLAGFTEIDAGGAFDVDVMVEDGPIFIEVTVDDNLVEHLEVEVNNGRLKIGFGRGNYTTDTPPTAVVRLPQLTAAETNGASSMRVTGAALEALRIDASGASDLQVDSATGNLVVEASGASTVTLTGDVAQLDADASGASDIDARTISATEADVDASGASTIRIGEVANVSGGLSGASTLYVPASTAVDVDTSGASEIEQRDES